MKDEAERMPERIWAGDFDRHGFGHCVAGMQGGLYEEYVRADLAQAPAPSSNVRVAHPDQTSPMTVGPEAFFDDWGNRS